MSKLIIGMLLGGIVVSGVNALGSTPAMGEYRTSDRTIEYIYLFVYNHATSSWDRATKEVLKTASCKALQGYSLYMSEEGK